jgi:hypothetical protein
MDLKRKLVTNHAENEKKVKTDEIVETEER